MVVRAQWTGASSAEQEGVRVGMKRFRYQGLGRLATPVHHPHRQTQMAGGAQGLRLRYS